jgi:multidrug efflux pump subunit AcrA (membrane-fusion protein)
MTVSAKIGIQRHEKVLLAPVEAVVTDKSGTYVWLLNTDKAAKRLIKTGFNDGKNVEMSDGVSEGEALLLPGKATLKDGALVKVLGTA